MSEFRIPTRETPKLKKLVVSAVAALALFGAAACESPEGNNYNDPYTNETEYVPEEDPTEPALEAPAPQPSMYDEPGDGGGSGYQPQPEYETQAPDYTQTCQQIRYAAAEQAATAREYDSKIDATDDLSQTSLYAERRAEAQDQCSALRVSYAAYDCSLLTGPAPDCGY